jgi:hypothetical protein
MAHAILFPEPEKGGRGKKTVQPVDSFSKQSLSNARAVLAYSPELARNVRDGRCPPAARRTRAAALIHRHRLARTGEPRPPAQLLQKDQLRKSG